MLHEHYFGEPDIIASKSEMKLTVDASADPYAPGPAANGKTIFTLEEAAENLLRYEIDFMQGNYGVADDGVLTYGFWTYEQFMDSYFFDLRYSDGSAFNDDAYYAETYGLFEAFTAQQEAAAADAIELWDDLLNVSFEAVAPGEEGDIMFGAAYMSPQAGAHAYFPQAEALDNYYGTTEYGKTSGDVMINWYYNSPTGDDAGTIVNRPAADDFSDLSFGSYANFVFVHELGHSLGMPHAGDYNASTTPPPITYQNHAYFYQDSQQYTIMSYFGGAVTGQGALNWDKLTIVMTQTPAVHDIYAMQMVYGADLTTRTGDTVYGFNSTAGKDIFDFTENTIPMLTIWDAGGNDTLDLSGFNSDSIININEGEFSSAGYQITAEQKAATMTALGITTEAVWLSFLAKYAVRPDGSPTDNIAIAYGAKIENATGGAGQDTLIGNALDNVLKGGAGNDVIAGGAGSDKLFGGAGSDLFVFTSDDIGYADQIRDFQSGQDMIDLTSFGNLDAGDVRISGKTVLVDTDGMGGYDLTIVVQGSKVTMSDIAFSDSDIDLNQYVPSQDLFLAA